MISSIDYTNSFHTNLCLLLSHCGNSKPYQNSTYKGAIFHLSILILSTLSFLHFLIYLTLSQHPRLPDSWLRQVPCLLLLTSPHAPVSILTELYYSYLFKYLSFQPNYQPAPQEEKQYPNFLGIPRSWQ